MKTKEINLNNYGVSVNEITGVGLINGGYYGAYCESLNITIFDKETNEDILTETINKWDFDDYFNIMPVSDESIFDYYYDDIDYIEDIVDDELRKALQDSENDDDNKALWDYVYAHLDDYYNMILENSDEDFYIINEDLMEEILEYFEDDILDYQKKKK